MSDTTSPPGPSTLEPDGHPTVSTGSMQSLRAAERGRWWRRAAGLAIFVFVVAGLANVWGPRTEVVRSRGELHQIEVAAPRVTRGGLPAGWQLTVQRIDGAPLAREIDVEVDLRHLAIFDQHATDPTPAETWTDGDTVYWRFDVPDGITRFTVTIDGRIQPDMRWRRQGTTTVRIGDDTITAHSTTWLLP